MEVKCRQAAFLFLPCGELCTLLPRPSGKWRFDTWRALTLYDLTLMFLLKRFAASFQNVALLTCKSYALNSTMCMTELCYMGSYCIFAYSCNPNAVTFIPQTLRWRYLQVTVSMVVKVKRERSKDCELSCCAVTELTEWADPWKTWCQKTFSSY